MPPKRGRFRRDLPLVESDALLSAAERIARHAASSAASAATGAASASPADAAAPARYDTPVVRHVVRGDAATAVEGLTCVGLDALVAELEGGNMLGLRLHPGSHYCALGKSFTWLHLGTGLTRRLCCLSLSGRLLLSRRCLKRETIGLVLTTRRPSRIGTWRLGISGLNSWRMRASGAQGPCCVRLARRVRARHCGWPTC